MKKGATLAQKNERLWGYLLILPFILGLLFFYVSPFFQNLYTSFTDQGSFGKGAFIGWENYRTVATSPRFYQALKNTIQYVLLTVPLLLVLATLLAVLLNSSLRGRTFFRTALFIPAVTMPAAIGLLWQWLYNYEFGIINFILKSLKIPPLAWLSDPKISLYSITLVSVWSMVSYQMIIILAGLQNISRSYYEAAQIDGASPTTIFFKVTLPLLSPTLFFVSVISVINIFQIFDLIFLMIRPDALSMQYTMSLVYYFYERGFIAYQKGLAAAVSLILFLIIFIVSLVQLFFQKRWVHYEG